MPEKIGASIKVKMKQFKLRIFNSAPRLARGSNIPKQPTVPPRPNPNPNYRPPNTQHSQPSVALIPMIKGVNITRVSGGWEVEFKKYETKVFLPDGGK
jgi:hypothetical protein